MFIATNRTTGEKFEARETVGGYNLKSMINGATYYCGSIAIWTAYRLTEAA